MQVLVCCNGCLVSRKKEKGKKKGEGWQEPLVFALARLNNHACNQRTYPPYRPFPLQLLSSIIRIQYLSTIWPLGFPHRRAIDADARGVRKVTIIAGFLAGVGLLGPLLPTEGPFTHALQSKWIGLWSDGKARNEPSEGRKTNNHPSQLPKPANPYESISNIQPDKGNKKTLASTANRAAYFFILFFILRWNTIKDKNNEKKRAIVNKARSWDFVCVWDRCYFFLGSLPWWFSLHLLPLPSVHIQHGSAHNKKYLEEKNADSSALQQHNQRMANRVYSCPSTQEHGQSGQPRASRR